jgi:hypothetical protein
LSTKYRRGECSPKSVMPRDFVCDPGTGENIQTPAVGRGKDGNGGRKQQQHQKPAHRRIQKISGRSRDPSHRFDVAARNLRTRASAP